MIANILATGSLTPGLRAMSADDSSIDLARRRIIIPAWLAAAAALTAELGS